MKHAVPSGLPELAPGLSLSRLRAMTAVAEEGSFSAAARRLGISHSAVSQQIRELEARHGVHLFDRQNGQLRPTSMCLELCDVGVRVQEAQRDALHILGRRNAAGRRRLRVGLGNSMPGIAIIGEMMMHCPGLSVTVDTGSHEAILGAILKRDVDVAVLPDIPADARFRRVPVLTHEVVAIVAADNVLAHEPFLSLDRLAEEPLIFRSRGSSTQRVVDRAFRRARLTPEPTLTADTRDAVYEAVAVGIGIGFMWKQGTFRTDTVRRVAVPGIGLAVDEVVFALADDRNDLIDIFLTTAHAFSMRPAVVPSGGLAAD